MKIKCAHCGKTADKAAGAVNRARQAGLRIFCGRKCSGLGRRSSKTRAQKVAEKAAYDQEYRHKNLVRITARKAEYFKRTYDPDAARIERKKRSKAHVEYCRQPAYKAYKHNYDRGRTDKKYGPFAEANRLLMDLNIAIKERATNAQIAEANQTLNKAQRRRREGKEERSRTRPRFRERRHGHSAAVSR